MVSFRRGAACDPSPLGAVLGSRSCALVREIGYIFVRNISPQEFAHA
jgi:hypothetical protein